MIWRPDTGTRLLADLLIDWGIDATGWQLDCLRGISADGTRLVGLGINPSGQEEAWLAVVPPVPFAPVDIPTGGGIGMLGAALGLGGLRRLLRPGRPS